VANEPIAATLYSDPGCPWAYSENPALRVLEWRYGAQLRWRLVMIGLREEASQYEELGHTPLQGALDALALRRYGMPFSPVPKARVSATAPACRAVVAARLSRYGSEWAVFRALQLANFNSPLLLDDDEQLLEVLRGVPGIKAEELVALADSPEVKGAYESDKIEAREASGSPAEFQGKAKETNGVVRFATPSVVFEVGARRYVAGGFQPIEAYDILVANLDPTLHREAPPETPAPLLARFRAGLTTQEVAALLAKDNNAPDRTAAEAALIELYAAGEALRLPLGDDALWWKAPPSA